MELLDIAIQDISNQYYKQGGLDAILLTGDFVVHGLASKVPGVHHWEEMKPILRQVIQRVVKAFPDVPIISNIGNNDVLYHYQTPTDDIKEMYYGELYNIWFSEVPALANNTPAHVNKTFQQGGYFRYDISEKLGVISLNSMIMSARNPQNVQDQKDVMFAWLDK